jgi:hypothetical protein
LRRREGDPGEDRPREHKSPAQGSEPGSSVSGGGCDEGTFVARGIIPTFSQYELNIP